MRKMKDSGVEWIGEIPEGWEVTKFKNMFSFGRGLPITKADLVEDGSPVINYGQIHSKQNDGVNLSDNLIKFVSPQFLKSNPESLLENGDFVFADTSEDYEGIGNAIFIDYGSQIFAGYHTVICRPRYSGIDKYFAYLFTTDAWRNQLRQIASGIKVFSITQAMLSGVMLLKPPLETQQKISAFLDRKCSQIDAILASIRRSIEKLKEYRQAVITQAVAKGLDPDAKMKDSGVEWIGEIPEGWEIKRLKNLSDLSPSVPITLEENQEVSFFPMENIKNGCAVPYMIYLKDISDKIYNICSNNDILVAKVTPCFENGNIAIAENLANGLGFATTEIFVIRPTSCHVKFLFYFLQNENFKRRAVSTMTGTGGLKRISPRFMRDEKLAVPRYVEQQKISAYLDQKTAQIDSLIAEKQKLHDKFAAYRKSLIYEHVTGKREVPDHGDDNKAD